MGHAAGHTVLASIATRLPARAGPLAAVGRLGGRRDAGRDRQPRPGRVAEGG
ncbi:hypothetical protein ACFY7Z_29930 [Streptomyces sp. NPDC012623]|uniref:hypothetical protein n=1 Tax=unclassified Streptomyces TaxID=2593676 RepID=UPI0036AF1202